jgi:hypothetical protein
MSCSGIVNIRTAMEKKGCGWERTMVNGKPMAQLMPKVMPYNAYILSRKNRKTRKNRKNRKAHNNRNNRKSYRN